MMKKIALLGFLGLWLALPVSAEIEQTHVNLRVLSAEAANAMTLAAYKDCLKKGYHVAAAVVTREGRMLSMTRSPLAGAHTIKVAEGKAFTAATFKTATTRLMGREFMRDIPDALIIGGGLPINIGGHFYGAIGVSGAPAKKTPGDVDDECAIAGIDAVKDDIEMGAE